MDDLIRSHRRWLKDSVRKTVDWNATGQSRLDALLHLDGEEEFVIYLAPVGKHAVSG